MKKTILDQQFYNPDRAEVALNEVIELAIASDDFRSRLQKKLNELSETKTPGRRPIPRWKAELVKMTVELIKSHYNTERTNGWKEKTTTTGALKEAAKVLGITVSQAKDRYYK